MNRLFENQKSTMIEDYERRLKELEERKTSEFNDMQSNLQKQIDDLKRLLEEERANLHGDAQAQRQKM